MSTFLFIFIFIFPSVPELLTPKLMMAIVEL